MKKVPHLELGGYLTSHFLCCFNFDGHCLRSSSGCDAFLMLLWTETAKVVLSNGIYSFTVHYISALVTKPTLSTDFIILSTFTKKAATKYGNVL